MSPVYPAPPEVEQAPSDAGLSAVQDLAAAAVAAGGIGHAHFLDEGHELADFSGSDGIGGGEADPLENDANKCRPPGAGEGGAGDILREQRWAAMRVLWDFSTLQRVKNCRRVVARTGSGPTLRVTPAQVAGEPGSAGLGGLQTCGSVWACPVCSARIQGERRRELVQALDAAHRIGSVALITRTVRHKKGQALADLCRLLGECHRAISKDKRVAKMRAELGFYGYVRAREITHGRHGWHPHDHSIYLFYGKVSAEQLAALQKLEVEVWSTRAKNLGVEAPLSKAQDARLVARSFDPTYLVKGSYGEEQGAEGSVAAQAMAFEMAGAATKTGKGKTSRTPWQILADVVELGDADDLALWWEYEKATRGMRALTWSRGLKKRYGIGEKSDEEITEEDEGGSEVLVLDDWEALTLEPRLIGQLLNAARWRGAAGAIEFCEERGIAWSPPGGGDYEDDDGPS